MTYPAYLYQLSFDASGILSGAQWLWLWHLQHAKIEKDTSRQSGQFRWPHTHLSLRRGHSGRLIIGESSYY